ncbi:MAG: mechanosensitive ion channel family protein [Crocinitomix sp.]|nr:mechanosensitive ion channel family protein [Crocinitomix sp.]
MMMSTIQDQTLMDPASSNTVIDTSASGFASNQATALDSLQSQALVRWTNDALGSVGVEGDSQMYLRTLLLLLGATFISFILWWVTKKVLIEVIHRFVYKSKTKWDDYLVKNKVFSAIAHLVPFLFLDFMILTVFSSFPLIADFLLRATDIVIIVIILYFILRTLNTAKDVLIEKPRLKDKPIESYFQLGKIVIRGLFIILIISIAFKIEPLVILTSMGALTAILILVFKDTILGFVGSIQLAANDMVRIGDWITMEKYGADGDVIEINLATVKVQNFDKTITTIPTYSFISDSFKNWRGMLDSDGRRIVRSIHIKIHSIKFCTSELLNKIGEIELIRNYIDEKEKEILDFNDNNQINKTVLLNGRNQTNIGIFRYYIQEYLEKNPDINGKMTLMVRQLDPSDKGVPIQLYTFTKTHDWVEYELIMADIFDHLLAAVPFFDLEVFEQPAGSDMRRLAQ